MRINKSISDVTERQVIFRKGYNLIFNFFDLRFVTDNIALNAMEHKVCHVVTVKKGCRVI